MTSDLRLHYKQNRLKQLRAFCQAVKVGSISLAAEKLYLSQPTVSLQIQALEREFNSILFERRGPHIRLTPEGDALYRLAQPLVEGMDKLHETFTNYYGRFEEGTLDIAAGEATILYILPEPIKRFLKEYPGIDLRLHNVTGRDGLTMLRSDTVDLAVGSMLDVPDDILYYPFVTYQPTLITPLDHPLAQQTTVTLAEIAQFGLILPPRHLSTWRMVDTVFRHHGLSYTVALEAGGWEVIKKYVQLGLGLAIVTDVCLTGQESLQRIPVHDYFPTRSYGIVLRRGKFLSPQTKQFQKMLKTVFPEQVSAPVDPTLAQTNSSELLWDDGLHH
jgi:DNA-binding transcriptional LysR family regulator